MSQLEFHDNGDKEYEVEAICNSPVYAKKSESSHLPDLHYLISWKSNPKKKNTWELASAIKYLWRLFNIFQKKHLEKPTITLTPIDIALQVARPTVKPGARNNKQKNVRPAMASSLTNTPKTIEPRCLLVLGPTSVFSYLKSGGFFTNIFSFSPAEPPRLADWAYQLCYNFLLSSHWVRRFFIHYLLSFFRSF